MRRMGTMVCATALLAATSACTGSSDSSASASASASSTPTATATPVPAPKGTESFRFNGAYTVHVPTELSASSARADAPAHEFDNKDLTASFLSSITPKGSFTTAVKKYAVTDSRGAVLLSDGEIDLKTIPIIGAKRAHFFSVQNQVAIAGKAQTVITNSLILLTKAGDVVTVTAVATKAELASLDLRAAVFSTVAQ